MCYWFACANMLPLLPLCCRFAFGWVLLLTIMLVLGTKESAMFNLVVTIVHIVLVVFIIIVSGPALALVSLAGRTCCLPGWRVQSMA